MQRIPFFYIACATLLFLTGIGNAQTSENPVNVAPRALITPSSVYQNEQSFGTQNLIDGVTSPDGSNQWLAQGTREGTQYVGTLPAWLIFDLQSEFVLSNISMFNTKNSPFNDTGTKEFSIQVSSDGVTYSAPLMTGQLEWQTSSYQTFQFPSFVSARYVKINLLSAYTNASGLYDRVGLTEVKILAVGVPSVVDSDGDGVNDAVEALDGTDPHDFNSYNAYNRLLVAWYPFNGNANDESGNGNNGAINGATLAVDRLGNTQGCYFFGGYNNIQIPHSVDLAPNQGTVSLWVKANTWMTSDNAADLIGKDANDRQWVLQVHGQGGDFPDGAVRAAVFTENGLGYGDSAATLPRSTWVHVAQVWNGTNIYAYFNGSKIVDSTALGNLASGSGPVRIGGNTGSSLDGWIDDVRIYKRALTPAEIQQLYRDSNLDGVEDSVAVSLGYDPMLNLRLNSLRSNPPSGLYSQSQYDSNRTAGRNEILNSPNSYNLYNTNQIQNLGLGGIILNRNTNNQLVLNYQILQSTDLQNWAPYQLNELVISNTPSDKMFLRVQAVGQ